MSGIPFELRDQAREMYIVDGLTLADVEKRTGISLASLKKYSVEECWSDKRREYREALSGIRRKKNLLRVRLIEKALSSLDPQDVYAVSRLEKAMNATSGSGQPDGPSVETREINTPDDAVEALQSAVQQKVNRMLARPEELSFAGIKDMKRALDLLEDMKSKQAEEDALPERRGLSDETVEHIKRRILGIS